MGKHTDALKPLDEFRAPWETESGDDAEIDKPKLKRFIYNLFRDKAKAQDARDELDEAVKEAEKALEDAKAELTDANGEEAQKKIDRLQSKLDAVTAERDELVSKNEEADLRAEVLGDFATKHPNAAKYVTGKTQEELKKSLEAVKADFGIDDDDDDDDPDDAPAVRTRPQRLRTPGDPESGKRGTEEIDWEKVADDIVGNGPFG